MPAGTLAKNELRYLCTVLKKGKRGVLAEILLCCILNNGRAPNPNKTKILGLKVLCMDIFEF